MFLPKYIATSVLPCDLLYQAHKAGTIKVLQDAADFGIPEHWGPEVYFCSTEPKIWHYMGNNARRCHSLKEAKHMDTYKIWLNEI